jgi:hypothetical protein
LSRYAFDRGQILNTGIRYASQTAEARQQLLPPSGTDAFDFLDPGRLARLCPSGAHPGDRKAVCLIADLRNQHQRSYERLDKKRRATGLSPAERQQHSGLLTATTKRFPQCQQAVEAGWRKEVFDLVMQEARKNAANPRKGFW